MTDDAAAAFALLGEPTRLDILRALGDPIEPGRVRELSFSELRDRVDAGSSRFNYHLDALRGEFVTRTESGYRLTNPGLLVYTAMRDGRFGEGPELAPFELDADCHECGASLHAEYVDGALELWCDDCGAFLYQRPVPPAVLEREGRDGLLTAAAANLRMEFGERRAGRCPVCGVRVESEFTTETAPADDRDLAVIVRQDCPSCAIFAFPTVGELLSTHPAVRGFCYEHGLDLTTTRPWTIDWMASDVGLTVESCEPWRVSVVVTAGDESRTFVVDESLSVAARRS